MYINMKINWNFVFSAITAIIAIIALIQAKQQIKMSNKQHLFDIRVEHYLIAKGLMQLYETNQYLLMDVKNVFEFKMHFFFTTMTNNTYLEDITNVISHPLEQPYQKQFLIRMEMMKDASTKIKYVFNGKPAVLLKNFVLCYQELLFEMYQHQIQLNDIKLASLEYNGIIDNVQEILYPKEKHHLEELQKVIDNLNQAYNMLKKANIEEKIEKQIKLK